MFIWGGEETFIFFVSVMKHNILMRIDCINIIKYCFIPQNKWCLDVRYLINVRFNVPDQLHNNLENNMISIKKDLVSLKQSSFVLLSK